MRMPPYTFAPSWNSFVTVYLSVVCQNRQDEIAVGVQHSVVSFFFWLIADR